MQSVSCCMKSDSDEAPQTKRSLCLMESDSDTPLIEYLLCPMED